MNNDNILQSIKKLIGIYEDDTSFDQDLIIHINTIFSILKRLGVGPTEGYKLKTGTEEWSEFTKDDNNLEAVKSYIYVKVKLVFDPPSNSMATESLKNMAQELEWSLNVMAESEVYNE